MSLKFTNQIKKRIVLTTFDKDTISINNFLEKISK